MQGQIQDVPLNATGIAQAEAAAAALTAGSFDLMVSSTLHRAAHTAQIIAKRHPVPIVYDERLIERAWGVAEGLIYKDFARQDPETFFTKDGKQDWLAAGWRQPKGSESRDALADRAHAALKDILVRYSPHRLLLVTHGAWLRALTQRLTGIDTAYPNAVPFVAQEAPAGWLVSRLNEA